MTSVSIADELMFGGVDFDGEDGRGRSGVLTYSLTVRYRPDDKQS